MHALVMKKIKHSLEEGLVYTALGYKFITLAKKKAYSNPLFVETSPLWLNNMYCYIAIRY